jgi:hypothetical protein
MTSATTVHFGPCTISAPHPVSRAPKMGGRTLRRPLIIGASAVVRKAVRQGTAEGSWFGRVLARKPGMLIIVALANKMARIAWAEQAKGEVYRAPAVVAWRATAGGVGGVGRSQESMAHSR